MIIHNPTDVAINDYPIQDPETKKTRLWGIKGGETLKFPDYVGQYLLDTYGYLQKIQTQAEYEAEQAQKKRVDSGQHFNQLKVIKKDVAPSEAPAQEIKQPESVGGFTNQLMQTPPAAQAVVGGSPVSATSTEAPTPSVG